MQHPDYEGKIASLSNDLSILVQKLKISFDRDEIFEVCRELKMQIREIENEIEILQKQNQARKK